MYFGSLKSFETITQKYSTAQTSDADELKQRMVCASSVSVSQLLLAARVLMFTQFQTWAQPEDLFM